MNTRQLSFAFSTDGTFITQLEAEVELPGAAPHYHVKNIHIAGNGHKASVIPDLSIKCVVKMGLRMWVHIDSNLPSDLSRSIGERLESILPEIRTAPAADPLEEDDLTAA